MSSKQFFDQVAGDWDTMRANFYSERVREKAFTIAGVRPRQLAADVGAVTGLITEGLIRMGVRVIAIDQSESMLAAMKKILPISVALRRNYECQITLTFSKHNIRFILFSLALVLLTM